MPKQNPNTDILSTLPSWCNNAGRVDRSACFEVRGSWVRRDCLGWGRGWVLDEMGRPISRGAVLAKARGAGWGERVAGLLGTQACERKDGDRWGVTVLERAWLMGDITDDDLRAPAEAFGKDGSIARGFENNRGRGRMQGRPVEKCWTDASTEDGRLATAVVQVDASDLLAWDKRMAERVVVGDRRGPRANAMRPDEAALADDDARPWERSANSPCGRRGRADMINTADAGDEKYLAMRDNPNRGANRSKLLGVDDLWSQPVRLERWRLAATQGVHTYLICPGCSFEQLAGAMKLPMDDPQCADAGDWARDEYRRCSVDDARLPALSTLAHGLKARGCPQRVQFLYLVMCMPAEAAAAHEWRAWLDGLTDEQREQERELIARAWRRFGPIMRPRVLLCRRCLGMRYGYDPVKCREALRQKKRRAGLITVG